MAGDRLTDGTSPTDGTSKEVPYEEAIERALAVDPSPDFTARVRTRIASEPVPGGWRLSWATCFAGGAVVAAAFVMYVALSQPRRQPAVSSEQAQTATASLDRSAQSLALQPQALQPQNAQTAPPRTVQSQAAVTATTPLILSLSKDEPEVLIDPREAMALQRLIAGVHHGLVDLSPLLRPEEPSATDLAEADPLVISPLSIEPLAPPEGAEGVRQ